MLLNPPNLHEISGLRVVIMPARAPAQGNEHLYAAVYNTWQSVWKQTLLELDGSDVLYSDHFTRQDYVVALFHGGRCAGLTCFRRADLALANHREDSWFKPWKPEVLEQIGNEYRFGIAVSWVTIHPDYRKSQSDERLRSLNVSTRLSEMLNLFLNDTQPEIAFGVTRNNRSVNKFCEYAGSKALYKDATHHGVSVDLITWKPEGVKEAQSAFPISAFKMWESREVYFDSQLKVTAPDSKRSKAAA